MTSITINATRRRWYGLQKKEWRCPLPSSWSDVPELRRHSYYMSLLEIPADNPEFLASVLNIPMWAANAIPIENREYIAGCLEWMRPEPQCLDLFCPIFEHEGVTYAAPGSNGSNVDALEYAIATEYFRQWMETKDESAARLVAATIYREIEPDKAVQLRESDSRQPLYSRAEVNARALRFEYLPVGHIIQACMWVAGLEKKIRDIYGAWIFDIPDDDDEEDTQTESTSSHPNFGWWGVYQEAAEAGLFGTLEKVYQTGIHDICIWLVRQKVKSEIMKEQQKNYKNDTFRD